MMDLSNTKLPKTLLQTINCGQGAVRAARFNGLFYYQSMQNIKEIIDDMFLSPSLSVFREIH